MKPLWTLLEDIKQKLRDDWNKGRLLAPLAQGEPYFPKRIPLKAPSTADMTEHFSLVQKWITSLESLGEQLEWKEIQHRQLGRNQIPSAVIFTTLEDAVRFASLTEELKAIMPLHRLTLERFPQLTPWLRRRPLRLWEHRADWPEVLNTLRWLLDHPQPGIYLRQVDLPGIHTKWLETHKSLLLELLGALETTENPRPATPDFESQLGFLTKPLLVRFRFLDPQLAPALPGLPSGPQEMTLTAQDFAALQLKVKRVIILENEITFLAFPAVKFGMAVFGSGFGFTHLETAQWLHRADLTYWGDLDTHGMAILSQLRKNFPQVKSLLMDRQTLLDHAPLWTREPQPSRAVLPHLTAEETLLYQELQNDIHGPAIRLEQERIPFGRILQALESP